MSDQNPFVQRIKNLRYVMRWLGFNPDRPDAKSMTTEDIEAKAKKIEASLHPSERPYFNEMMSTLAALNKEVDNVLESRRRERQ